MLWFVTTRYEATQHKAVCTPVIRQQISRVERLAVEKDTIKLKKNNTLILAIGLLAHIKYGWWHGMVGHWVALWIYRLWWGSSNPFFPGSV